MHSWLEIFRNIQTTNTREIKWMKNNLNSIIILRARIKILLSRIGNLLFKKFFEKDLLISRVFGLEFLKQSSGPLWNAIQQTFRKIYYYINKLFFKEIWFCFVINLSSTTIVILWTLERKKVSIGFALLKTFENNNGKYSYSCCKLPITHCSKFRKE